MLIILLFFAFIINSSFSSFQLFAGDLYRVESSACSPARQGELLPFVPASVNGEPSMLLHSVSPSPPLLNAKTHRPISKMPIEQCAHIAYILEKRADYDRLLANDCRKCSHNCQLLFYKIRLYSKPCHLKMGAVVVSIYIHEYYTQKMPEFQVLLRKFQNWFKKWGQRYILNYYILPLHSNTTSSSL